MPPDNVHRLTVHRSCAKRPRSRFTLTFTVRGTTTVEDGATHGHNIVAVDKGYVADPVNTTAPGGGTFPAAQLACTSCHNPHGQQRRLSDGTIASTGAPITGYKVYRWSAGSPVTVITLDNVTSYKATGLTKGVIYSLQVSASNSGGEGAKSSTVTAKPS